MKYDFRIPPPPANIQSMWVCAHLMVLRMLQRIGSPVFLLISQLQEPLYVLSVVAMPIQ